MKNHKIGEKNTSSIFLVYFRYPKEIMKMEQEFSGIQRWLQK